MPTSLTHSLQKANPFQHQQPTTNHQPPTNNIVAVLPKCVSPCDVVETMLTPGVSKIRIKGRKLWIAVRVFAVQAFEVGSVQVH